MLKAMLLTFAVSSHGADAPISCVFPSHDESQKALHLSLDPRPSLKDQPGLYRVMMDFEGKFVIRAAARPIEATEDRDILIRGIVRNKSMYSIGLRADGTAALNIQNLKPGKHVDKRTRMGECRGHEVHVDRWLSS